MKIHLATDHAGFGIKQAIKAHLEEAGHEVIDHGAYELVPDDDYPDFVMPAAKAIAEDPSGFGIILGGSGQGEAIAVNRFVGVRAAVYYGGSLEIVRLAREHNNANILSLGAHFLDQELALQAVGTFLATSFSEDERHVRRLFKINEKPYDQV